MLCRITLLVVAAVLHLMPVWISLFTELLITAEGSANITVLRTPPGAAQFLASSIDQGGLEAIMGTIAGDDTVLVVTRDPNGGAALAESFLDWSAGQ